IKMLIGECKQEVSTFNPALSHYEDFVVERGQGVIDAHRGGHTEMAGALSVFERRPDVLLAPTYSARSITSAGPLAAADFARLAREFLESVRAAGPVDAVFLALHGAMAAEDEGDPEGYLLQEIRAIVGDRAAIVISLDLHGILTDRMLEQIDALTAFHTYPHVDLFDTGARAAHLLLRILDESLSPVVARVAIPALVRGDELITETGLFGRSIRAAQALESASGGLAAGMFIGNPFTDVPELRSNSFVITDGDRAQAEQGAESLAREFWAFREHLQAPLTPLPEAMYAAQEFPSGTVVLVDAADATSSGASGDSNAILRACLDAGYRGRTLMPIVDQAAVAAARAAGIGATIRVPLGGSIDQLRFQPVTLEARVRLLSDGRFTSEADGTEWYAGDTAVLEAGNHTIVTTSRTVSLYDRSLFLAHGQDPRRFDLVVVKSPHCRPEFYRDWAALYINVDAPGSTSANLESLGHTVCARPIFPLDGDVPFIPRARIFRRSVPGPRGDA
ncbi:MAG: microcystin degradation protein MlrC, partial [Chloroflexi bacterium]|nr:microcystin degradation protein MlrC [Chloroflexota bacterium]